MAKTRAIVKRRKAIRNIRKITRTMELIATARFKKAMDRASQAEAYTRKIGELVADLSRSGAAADHPLLEEHPKTEKSVLLTLTSNRGLCGGYNANVLRSATAEYRQLTESHSVDLEVAGKRGIGYFTHQQIPMTQRYLQFDDKPAFDEVEPIAERLMADYIEHRIDRLDVAYTRFISAGRQQAEVVTLLPMSAIDEEEEPSELEKVVAGKGAVEYEFLPSAEDILAELVPASFKAQLFKCFLDAAVSEQISRMVAMKGATENADSLIKRLTMRYNRARQSQITSELSEIIGTAEALK
ncbi:ATP synthase gamma chain [Planctomycetes bacterium Pan216]|uniref:ATP synthase gamma chain n=1 Tax=Kolteria novifilia TaxID=2527975 RepID=A0A518B8C2_9BACT|nr:ATP synthase gamma chain [Planctomycetes bacterium Pan216]